jgi:predicted DNA-binding transcriptional regulator YafY
VEGNRQPIAESDTPLLPSEPMARPRSARKPVPAARQLTTKPPLRRFMWALGRLRANKPLKATDLAEEFEINVRTAYRDIDFLRDQWGVPLEYDRGKQTYVLTEPLAELPPVLLSEGELIAIYFAEKVLAQYRNTPFEGNLARAFGKIQELLPEATRASPSGLDDYLSFDPGPLHTPDAAIFKEVLHAHRVRRKLRIRYRSLSSNRTWQRTVHPYHVFNHHGDWYLAAFDERRGEIRIFALHRIRRAVLTTEPFEMPSRFSFQRYMEDAFGIQKGEKAADVSIRFGVRQARWIRERRWHPTARVQEEIDGRIVLHLKVAETSEIKRWVMQFGKEAEVLTPRSLRQAVKEDLQAAVKLYRGRRPRTRSGD